MSARVWVTRVSNSSPRLARPAITPDRLAITSDRIASRRWKSVASWAACTMNELSDTPSPCSAWMNVSESRFTCSGCSTWNSGWKPLSSAEMSKDGSVRSTGMVPLFGSAAGAVASPGSSAT
ncbi:Uncharacterised protein [Mycobacteroides abscessus subsp. abscessus]|nr:Uncharacterised protein [Mycobacteroides abscessus subsp. abscessus]